MNQKSLDADLSDVLATTQGRRLFQHLLDRTGFLARNAALDPAVMNRCEGRREIGAELFEWVMRVNPNVITETFQEQARRIAQTNKAKDRNNG